MVTERRAGIEGRIPSPACASLDRALRGAPKELECPRISMFDNGIERHLVGMAGRHDITKMIVVISVVGVRFEVG